MATAKTIRLRLPAPAPAPAPAPNALPRSSSSSSSPSSSLTKHTRITDYPKQRYPLNSFWWRRRIWIESTFALTVYEPWEKYLVLTIFAIWCTAMLVVAVKYLPQQFIVMRRRSIYYIWGEQANGSPSLTEAALWQYLGLEKPN